MAGTAKFERLVNLYFLLVYSERPRTAAWIRDALGDYADLSDQAFHRKFERDKNELRDLGIEIVQEDVDAFGGEVGYRIAADTALLRDPGLTADEIAALSLAVGAWGSDDGNLALLKVSAATGPWASGPLGWQLPRVALDEQTQTLVRAIQERRVARFVYQPGTGKDPEERVLEPHALHYRGGWYVGGHDRGRHAIRHFKVSRIVGTVTIDRGAVPQFDPPEGARADIMHGPWDADEPQMQATVRFAPDIAWWVQRKTGATHVSDHDDGSVDLSLSVSDVDLMAGWLAGFGARAVVLEPPALRDAVIAALRPAAGEDA